MLSFIKNLFAKWFGKSEPVQATVVAVEEPKGWPYDEPAKEAVVTPVTKPQSKSRTKATKAAQATPAAIKPAQKAVRPSVKAKSVRKPKTK
jgi:hypothetical protein